MSVDKLQEKIRKGKNALIVEMPTAPEQLPPAFREENSIPLQMERYCRDLLAGLKGIVPGVRFRMSPFALMGPEGLSSLSRLLKAASGSFYVLLDAPMLLNGEDAAACANSFFGDNSDFPCDGAIVSVYPGTDVLKPFLPFCKEQKKDLFTIVRTTNRSASELQDLLTGSRLVHSAGADLVNRLAEDVIGRCGYSRVGLAASAGSAESLRNLRAKYPKLFLLADGADCPWASGKAATYAFDRMGHGAAVCVGSGVTEAWKREEGGDPVSLAAAAAERLNKNLLRYISIL